MIIMCTKIKCGYFNKNMESNCCLGDSSEVAEICMRNNHKYYEYYIVKEVCYEV